MVRAALPAHLSPGGFAHVSLSLADVDSGSALVVRQRPLQRREDGRAELFDLDEAETAVLLDDVETLEFSYFGVPERREDPEWTDRWDNPTRLPLLVRIRIGFPDTDRRIWPALTVGLMIQESPAVLPWALGFAAGALIYLVMADLLPESYREAGSTSIALAVILALWVFGLVHGALQG